MVACKLSAMAVNPYEAFLDDDVAEAPPSQGWRVEDNNLYVRPGAVLPMVDPFTGESEDRMTMLRLGVRRRVLWPKAVFAVGTLLLVASALTARGPVFAWIAWLMVAAGFGGGVYLAVVSSPLEMNVFSARRSLRQRIMRRWLVAGLVGNLLLFLILPHIPWFPMVLVPYLGVIAAGLLLGTAMVAISRKELRHRKMKGGELKVLGVHPAAMKILAGIPPEEGA